MKMEKNQKWGIKKLGKPSTLYPSLSPHLFGVFGKMHFLESKLKPYETITFSSGFATMYIYIYIYIYDGIPGPQVNQPSLADGC